MKILTILLSTLLLTSCFSDDASISSTQLGQATFEQNCVSCHGKNGEGIVKDWKKRQADGSYPAPQVNGSAHAWHHSPKTLLSTINNGGAKLGGQMPAFKDQLSEEEKQALLDYMYSLWPKDIQVKYSARFK